jgi:tetratricopeptide (TPR) repeat protein
LERAQELLDEAGRAYDEAVAVAPRRPEPYLRRGTFRGLGQRLIARTIRASRGGRASLVEALRGQGENLVLAMVSPGAVSDFLRAARLSPASFRLVATAAFLEIFSFACHSGRAPDFTGPELWDSLPEKTRRSVREAMRRLEKLARSRDVDTAAGASHALGELQFYLLNDYPRALVNLRRAVTLDPARLSAWDKLAILTLEARRYQELVALCTERLKHQDSALNHLLLAKAYEMAGQLDEAEEQVEAALKLAPDDFIANFSLAVLLLKRADDAAALREAERRIARAGTALRKQHNPDQDVQFLLVAAIQEALAGDVEGARRLLESVLAYDPSNEDAKAALGALEEEAERGNRGKAILCAAPLGADRPLPDAIMAPEAGTLWGLSTSLAGGECS